MSTQKSSTVKLNMSFNPASEMMFGKKTIMWHFYDGYHQRLRCMGDRTVTSRHTKNIRHNNSGKTGSQKDVFGTELGIFDMLNEHE